MKEHVSISQRSIFEAKLPLDLSRLPKQERSLATPKSSQVCECKSRHKKDAPTKVRVHLSLFLSLWRLFCHFRLSQFGLYRILIQVHQSQNSCHCAICTPVVNGQLHIRIVSECIRNNAFRPTEIAFKLTLIVGIAIHIATHTEYGRNSAIAPKVTFSNMIVYEITVVQMADGSFFGRGITERR